MQEIFQKSYTETEMNEQCTLTYISLHLFSSYIIVIYSISAAMKMLKKFFLELTPVRELHPKPTT